MPTNPPHLRPPELPLHETLLAYADIKKARSEPTFCVQVGANDGRTNDPVHPYLTGYGWRGLLIEPLVDVFEQELSKTYAGYPNVTLANVALAPTNGNLPLYRVAISRARWATGLSGFRRDNLENHIANGYIEKKAKAEGVAMPSDPDDVIEVVQVPTKTVATLLSEHKVDQFDVLCIDTEGFDFEVLIGASGFNNSLSPGIEQIGRWGSAAARTEGSFNLAGVADPAIDAAIEAMLKARSKEDYVAAVRVLDRLLISGHYMVPMQYDPRQWIAYWTYLEHPRKTPIYGYQLPTWWSKPK